MPIRAKIFIAITTAAGFAVWVTAFLHWQSADPVKFACYLAIAVLAATMKIRLPGIESTMSVHFLFVLLGVLELSLPETLAIGCAAALVQSLWKTQDRPEGVKVLFNVVSMTAPAVFLDLLDLPVSGDALPAQYASAFAGDCSYVLLYEHDSGCDRDRALRQHIGS